MYLKDRSNKDGVCWPSIRTIAGELKLSRATVCRALDDLCKAGLLAKGERWRENGGRTSNFYKIEGKLQRADFSTRGEVCSYGDMGSVSQRDTQKGKL